ncbi:MAG TPA: hypothetical protein PKD09_19725 [Aggregatilinea sp.]|uniref:hypothetical protein n=1 Tax=Aggregatilinea sp. TaxID=2806333 RepID=UPI002BD9AB85|nr:hypothetical protein [Aggregatilinea sp.]HML23895.1 hypothetical protein [Aggregatilinea sp.]
MLTMSNLYGHGFDRQQLEMFEALGFTLRPQESIYMGSQICRFIDFNSGPALELIEVEDRAAYEAFVPAGMAPYCPGISLVVAEGATALDEYEREFAALEPYRLHVPYTEGDERGPGWHYLNFGVPVVRDTFLWLTAYDEPKPASGEHCDHANGVQGVVGLVFDLSPADLACLSRLTGQSLVDGMLTVGSVAVIANSADGSDLGGSPKTFPLRAVVMRASSLDAFASYAPGAQNVTLMGRPALLVEMNPLSWDVLVTA